MAHACTGVRHSPATRYVGLLLNARDLGAEELARAAAADPNVRAYLARAGNPDFLLEPSAHDLELVYYLPSRLVHFHRTDGGASVMTELTPLPNGVLNILPADPRAGTPRPSGAPVTGCWSTTFPDTVCRTCCRTAAACTIECLQRPTPGPS